MKKMEPGSRVRWAFVLLVCALSFLTACRRQAQISGSPPTWIFHTVARTIPPSRTIEPSATVTSSPTSEPSWTPTLSSTPLPSQTSTPSPTITPTPGPLVFAVIGDYGTGEEGAADVANLVLSWQPDLIITLGDNNYPYGGEDTIDENVGQFYHSYIYPYYGSYGEGADENRFFPVLGNHDVITDGGQPYFDYFTLPGNERYYDFVWGPVHFFALNNNDSEPDGVNEESIQGSWLQQKLAYSASPWNIVYMHYAPYSSGTHGSTSWARWAYSDWGADVVLSAHDHTYERLQAHGIPYFVNGLGGGGRYDFVEPLGETKERHNDDYGAMRIEATDTYLLFQFITRDGDVIDTYELRK